jgi:DNA-binding response OmpR family regulator
MASILVAEDDTDIAQLLATVLSDAGHTVRTAPPSTWSVRPART